MTPRRDYRMIRSQEVSLTGHPGEARSGNPVGGIPPRQIKTETSTQMTVGFRPYR